MTGCRDQAGWIGQNVDGFTAIAYGPPLANDVESSYFWITVDFTGSPLTGETYFDYFGYVGQTSVEGIRMYLADGSWTGNWGPLDPGTAPLVSSVPEPGTMLLLGTGLVSLGIFGRRKSRAKK